MSITTLRPSLKAPGLHTTWEASGYGVAAALYDAGQCVPSWRREQARYDPRGRTGFPL